MLAEIRSSFTVPPWASCQRVTLPVFGTCRLDPQRDRRLLLSARKRRSRDAWLISDSGSPDGTFVEHRRIHDPTPIALDAHIEVGDTGHWLWRSGHPSTSEVTARARKPSGFPRPSRCACLANCRTNCRNVRIVTYGVVARMVVSHPGNDESPHDLARGGEGRRVGLAGFEPTTP
jgi:hypothetical protein